MSPRWRSRSPFSPRWSSRPPAAVSRPPGDDLDTLRPQAASGYSIGAAPEREALARAAYGRTASADDEARAAEAARRLQELYLREAAERQALHRAALDAADARERRAHRIRSRSARVLGVLAVMGAIAAGAATFLAPPTTRGGEASAGPSTRALGPGEAVTPPTRAGTQLESSTTTGPAGSWFDEAQTARDRVEPSLLPRYVDDSTTRLVSAAVPGWRVYVAQGTNSELCLVALESGTTQAEAECVAPEVFAVSGVSVSGVGSTSISAFWDGVDVHVGPNGSNLGQNETQTQN